MPKFAAMSNHQKIYLCRVNRPKSSKRPIRMVPRAQVRDAEKMRQWMHTEATAKQDELMLPHLAESSWPSWDIH
jgi:hypothetical protein